MVLCLTSDIFIELELTEDWKIMKSTLKNGSRNAFEWMAIECKLKVERTTIWWDTSSLKI